MRRVAPAIHRGANVNAEGRLTGFPDEAVELPHDRIVFALKGKPFAIPDVNLKVLLTDSLLDALEEPSVEPEGTAGHSTSTCLIFIASAISVCSLCVSMCAV